jgi:hypothetical protein
MYQKLKSQPLDLCFLNPDLSFLMRKQRKTTQTSIPFAQVTEMFFELPTGRHLSRITPKREDYKREIIGEIWAGLSHTGPKRGQICIQFRRLFFFLYEGIEKLKFS